MRQNSTPRTVTLRELPTTTPTATPTTAEPQPRAAHPERDEIVFVTNAVRRRGLRARNDHHRPVLAAVVR